MSKKGIEFTMEVEEIKDYDTFMKNENCIKELKELIAVCDYGVAIGFSDDNVLMCQGKIINNTKKECEAEYTLFKGKYARILEKYYGKIKVIDRMKLYFTTLN